MGLQGDKFRVKLQCVFPRAWTRGISPQVTEMARQLSGSLASLLAAFLILSSSPAL